MVKTVSIYGMLILIMITSCELFDKTDPRPLHLTNNSNRNVIFYQNYALSDIYDPNLGSYLYSTQLEVIKKNSVGEYRLNGGRWEEYLASLPNGRMIVFVLDYDSVVKYARPNPTYPTDTSQILKKQFVNMDTLINNNWTLVYP
jgi:hypothetical protein